MKFNKFSIRTKLIMTFVVVGITPLLVSNFISYEKSKAEIEFQGSERAKLVAENKAHAIKDYFDAETNSIVDLAANPLVITAFEELSAPFEHELLVDGELAQKYKQEVYKYYSQQFGEKYFEITKNKLALDDYFSKLDLPALSAQYDFIANNENPLGKKDLMVTAKRVNPYAQSHTKYHTFFRNYLNRHALYDLFLVNPQGRIIYTVFKETDFATSLRNGPWAQTSIAKAFESSVKLEEGQSHIEDFATYIPSYDAPASFASTPLFKNGKYIGSLMIQLPLDKISVVAGNREGLGEKGETLLLGEDLKLRADTFRNKSTHSVATSFADSKVSVESEAVRMAKMGNKGFTDNVSYDGLKTLAYFMPLNIKNLNWYVITELSHDEVYSGLNMITYYTMIILFFGAVVIAASAILFGNAVAKNLKSIMQTLDKSSQEVSGASSQSASSATELSEAATEQAASLQQTMASVEQISAMVSQNADSASKTQVVVDQNQKASEDGSRNVDEMLSAIEDIKNTNEEILTQMEASNKEFAEIVKIISNIGEKTNVINDIVFQTKLLSFNASVEAARAGEHGKGFAVVAEEVGNLAQMSGNAAKEITDMLSDSIKKVNSIVENTKSRVEQLVEVGKDKITMGQSIAEKCKSALDKITENARSVVSMITEITHASKEQAQGIQEINKAITQLDQVTQQNSAVAQHSSSQAEQLNSEALILSEAVHKLVQFVDGSTQTHGATAPTATATASVSEVHSKNHKAAA